MESIVICSSLLFSINVRSAFIWIHSGIDSMVILAVEAGESGCDVVNGLIVDNDACAELL